VYRESIEWCQQTTAPRSEGRFEFHFLDDYSDAYNPNGTIPGNEVVFPVTEGSVDFAFGISLFFSHLHEEDSAHYLNEVRRVLVPGGRFLPTIHTQPEAGREYSGDEIKIDVSPEYIIRMAEAAGLRLQERLGSLCGQEAFIFTA
jgi:SAM-dependent methyltransferase